MVPFATPSRNKSYDLLGEKAARAALSDADVSYADVQQAYAGFVYGDSTCGQAALYRLGHSPRAPRSWSTTWIPNLL
jgi:sterol carrier protein 2